MEDFPFWPTPNQTEGAWDEAVTSSVKEQAKDHPLYITATKMSSIWQPLIIIVGLLGNFIIVLVMLQRSNRWNSCSNYIAALAVSDSIALIRKSMDQLYQVLGIKYTQGSCGAWVYIALSACQFSMLLVLCLTVDRMIAVRFPNRSSTYCSVGRARKVMVILLIPTLVFNIPHLFWSKPLPEGKYCAAFADTHAFSFIYGWLQLIINSIIPNIALFTITIIILKTLSKNRKMRESVRNTKQATDEGGSGSNINFITYIITDGLFNYVLSYIANGLKDLEKKISASSSTLPVSNGSVNSNRGSISLDQGGRGNLNQAYEDKYEESDVVDGKIKSITGGTLNTAYSLTGEDDDAGYNQMCDIDEMSPHLTAAAMDEPPETYEPCQAQGEGFPNQPGQGEVALGITLQDSSNPTVLGGEHKPPVELLEGVPHSAVPVGYYPAEEEECSEVSKVGVNGAISTMSLTLEEEDSMASRPVSLRRQASKERSRQMTVLLLLVVLFYFILTIPQFIRYIIYNANFVNRNESPTAYATYVLVYHISNKAYFTNCAVNFFLYLFGSSLFWESLKETFTCCCRKKRKEQTMEDLSRPVQTVSEGCNTQSSGDQPSTTVSTNDAISSDVLYSTYM